MFQSNNNNPYQSHDFLTDLKNWWDTCPLFTKFLIFFCSGLCVLSLFSNMPQFLVNEPSKTIGEFEITRLIFSPFTFFTLSEILFGFLVYLPESATEEKERGTLLAIMNFFLKNFEINIIFILLCYILSIISSSFLNFEAYGLWCIFFAGVVEKCLENPEGTTSFLFPSFRIQNKIYPIALVLLFSIVSNIIRLDMAAAALSGFLNFKFLTHYHNELLSNERIIHWESSSVIAWLRTLPNYVSHGTISGPLISAQDKSRTSNYPGIDYGVSLSPDGKGNNYGGSGVMIGGDGNKNVHVQRDYDDLEGDHELQ